MYRASNRTFAFLPWYWGIALAIANKVDNRLSKKGMIHHSQPIDNKGPDAGAFHSTVGMSGLPQKARRAVINRSSMSRLLRSQRRSLKLFPTAGLEILGNHSPHWHRTKAMGTETTLAAHKQTEMTPPPTIPVHTSEILERPQPGTFCLSQ